MSLGEGGVGCEGGGVSGGLVGISEGGHPGGSGGGKLLHSEGAGLLGKRSHTSVCRVSSSRPHL